MQDILDKSFYTLQQLFQEKTKAGKDKAAAVKEARSEADAKLLNDSKIIVGDLVTSHISDIVMPPISSEVIEPCQDAMSPVTDEIPDLLKDVVNPDDMLSTVVTTIVNNAVATAVQPSIPTFS